MSSRTCYARRVQPDFCSRICVGLDEPRAGTAQAEVRYWVLIEFAGFWGSKFVKDSGLPGSVRQHLAAVMDEVEGSRVQLIRREQPPVPGSPLTIFLADVHEQHPTMYRLSWPDVATLDQLDIVGLLTDPSLREPYRSEDTGIFVCTNGQRDRCCAKFGLELYRALAAIDPEIVWQTTHLGGHRFAPTTISLPDGYCYGHLESSDARAIVDAHTQKNVFKLEYVRGRVCYDQAAQAAEVVLRRQVGLYEYADVRWLGSTTEGDASRVVFELPGKHRVSLVARRVEGAGPRPKSCVEAPTPFKPWTAELPWAFVTREERFFCAHLAWQHLADQDGVHRLVQLINRNLAETERLPEDDQWDLCYEVNFYRDYAHLHRIPKSNRPQKRTFDLFLRRPGIAVVIEAKAQQGFHVKQLTDFEDDRVLLQGLLGADTQVLCVALTSSRYTMREQTFGYFDAVIHWSQLSEIFGLDPLLRRADVIYRD